MQNWFNWLPMPRSWVNAMGLILLMSGMQFAFSFLWQLIGWLIRLSPKFAYLFSLLTVLAPILLIALIHHWMHQGLDQFFPESRLPIAETTQGAFPGVLSWWKGLYGWLVSLLSAVISFGLIGLFLPFPSTATFSIESLIQAQPAWALPMLLRVVIAAYLYQFEYAVQQRLVAIGSASRAQ